MFATRRLAASIPRVSRLQQPSATALFHSTRPSQVQLGDPLPDLDVLTESSPGNKVNLAKELATGRGIIIGTPGAFSELQWLFLFICVFCVFNWLHLQALDAPARMSRVS